MLAKIITDILKKKAFNSLPDQILNVVKYNTFANYNNYFASVKVLYKRTPPKAGWHLIHA